MGAKPVPEGYHTVTPYLAVDDAAEAIEYYGKAFGATERVRMDTPDGKIGHAELEIGDSLVMLSDPSPQATTRTPKEIGGTTASVFLYVDDVDTVVKKAVDAGATVTMEVADQISGRSLRHYHRSVRPCVVDCHARRGCPARGDGGARQGGDGSNERLRRPPSAFTHVGQRPRPWDSWPGRHVWLEPKRLVEPSNHQHHTPRRRLGLWSGAHAAAILRPWRSRRRDVPVVHDQRGQVVRLAGRNPWRPLVGDGICLAFDVETAALVEADRVGATAGS